MQQQTHKLQVVEYADGDHVIGEESLTPFHREHCDDLLVCGIDDCEETLAVGYTPEDFGGMVGTTGRHLIRCPICESYNLLSSRTLRAK